MTARIIPYSLELKRPAGTSRGTLTNKPSYFILLEKDGHKGIGECGVFPGLSTEWSPQYEVHLMKSVRDWEAGCLNLSALKPFPSIVMGWETALRSLEHEDSFHIFESSFVHGDPIQINGLIWMGDESYMSQQIENRLEQGFSCIKLKIGALDWDAEYGLLKRIRQQFTAREIELRVDANGAFSPSAAMDKLEALASLDIHSIEQPIKAGDWNEMAKLCHASPLDIALDEELIGIHEHSDKVALIEAIRPKYLILKPSLSGGFSGSDEWIEIAEKYEVEWWATSALESNIGLNAIAQWAASKRPTLPQGLGTGSLYSNNIPSPLVVDNGTLSIDSGKSWNIEDLVKVKAL